MRAPVERIFIWSIVLAAVALVPAVIGLKSDILTLLPWILLLVAAGCVVVMAQNYGGVKLAGNRLISHTNGWLIAAIVAVLLWVFAQKWAQDAVGFLKDTGKTWDVFEPFALFLAAVFVLFGAAVAVVGSKERLTEAPGVVEGSLVTKLTSKIAAVPMVAVALGIFVGCSIWTVVYSFTNSKLLPKLNFVGFDQYERLWETNRWIISIKNLAIYGVCSLFFSLVIGFILAALLDQKIRFENTFRTILLYPFALSFIVTGLVWQWLLNPEFGIQKIVRDMGFSDFTFDPLYNADTVIYGVLFAGLWQGTGLIMCLMLAGLRGIDEDIWKAARVDGIPMWRTYVSIVIPMMRPVFVTTLVLIMSGIVRVFDLVVAQTNGGPGIASEVPAKYVYDLMFLAQNLGQGFAASTTMLLAVLVILIPWAYFEFGGRRQAND